MGVTDESSLRGKTIAVKASAGFNDPVNFIVMTQYACKKTLALMPNNAKQVTFNYTTSLICLLKMKNNTNQTPDSS